MPLAGVTAIRSRMLAFSFISRRSLPVCCLKEGLNSENPEKRRYVLCCPIKISWVKNLNYIYTFCVAQI